MFDWIVLTPAIKARLADAALMAATMATFAIFATSLAFLTTTSFALLAADEALSDLIKRLAPRVRHYRNKLDRWLA